MPVPSEPGPVGTRSDSFAIGAPPPRQRPRVDSAPAVTGLDRTLVATAPAVTPSVGDAPAVAGTIGVPGAPILDERGNLPAGLLALAGAAAVVAGVFLPWLTVEGHDVSGWRSSDDARILLALAGTATVIGALLVGGARSLVLRVALIGVGLGALALTVFDIASVGRVEVFDPAAGSGLAVSIGGSFVLVVAGLLARHRRFR